MVVVDLSKSLQKAIEDDRFVIVFENLSPRRRNRAGANVDILLTVEFPHSKTQLGFALDRKNHQGTYFSQNTFIFKAIEVKLNTYEPHSQINYPSHNTTSILDIDQTHDTVDV